MINQKEIKRIKKTFHNKGYVVLKNFIPRKLINEIKSDVTELLEKKMINNKLENIHYLKTLLLLLDQIYIVHNDYLVFLYHYSIYN